MKSEFKPDSIVTWGSGSPVAKIVKISSLRAGDDSWVVLELVEPLVGSCGIKSFPAGMQVCMPMSELHIRIEN
jgi:hypothetical protein